MDVTRIKELRDREGMTQKDVAEMIGVSQSTYRKRQRLGNSKKSSKIKDLRCC